MFTGSVLGEFGHLTARLNAVPFHKEQKVIGPNGCYD